MNGSTCEGIGRGGAEEEEAMLDSMNFSNTEPLHTTDRQQVRHKCMKVFVQYKLSVCTRRRHLCSQRLTCCSSVVLKS